MQVKLTLSRIDSRIKATVVSSKKRKYQLVHLVHYVSLPIQ